MLTNRLITSIPIALKVEPPCAFPSFREPITRSKSPPKWGAEEQASLLDDVADLRPWLHMPSRPAASQDHNPLEMRRPVRG